MKQLKHRIGAKLIDFSIDHLLMPDVAAVLRRQLDLGKEAILHEQRITVQLREDLRSPGTHSPNPDPNQLPEGI